MASVSWPEGLSDRYPALADLPAALRDELGAPEAQPISVKAGTVLFEEGAPCRGFPLVLDGEVRVARGSAQGRSLELYRVGPGELCVASASGLFETPRPPGPPAQMSKLASIGFSFMSSARIHLAYSMPERPSHSSSEKFRAFIASRTSPKRRTRLSGFL